MNRIPVMSNADKAKYGDAPTTDVNAGELLASAVETSVKAGDVWTQADGTKATIISVKVTARKPAARKPKELATVTPIRPGKPSAKVLPFKKPAKKK